MRPFVVMAAIIVAAGLALAGADEAKGSFIDLQPSANTKLKDGIGSEDNSLGELPTGEQTLAGVRFKIGEAYALLSGQQGGDKPDKAEEIKVGRKFARLYILHGTHYAVEDGTIIGSYTVTYEDRSQETIPIVYGKDVRDWWSSSDPKEATRGKVAWTGENAGVKAAGGKLRLYVTRWKNPEPDKQVVSIDFASTKSSAAAPFCVALTTADK